MKLTMFNTVFIQPSFDLVFEWESSSARTSVGEVMWATTSTEVVQSELVVKQYKSAVPVTPGSTLCSV